MWLEDLGDEADPAAALAADGVATRPQIDAAVHYRRAYSDEIAATYRTAPTRDGRRRRAVRLLLDEMYPRKLADALRAANVDATAAAELGLAGRPHSTCSRRRSQTDTCC